MESSIFWYETLCSLLNVNRHLGGTCHPYLQGGRISGLHGVLFRKMVLFITTAVRTSNPI
jgi:hypothetical protein